MSNTLITIVVALAVVALVTFRQTRWQSVKIGKLLVMPAVFAVVGLVELVGSGHRLPGGWHLQVLDVVILTAELGLGVAAGLAIGRWTEIATVDGAVRSRLVGAGVAVWLGFIALRIGLAVLAHVGGAAVAELPGTIFVVLAVVKVLQALVVRERINYHRATQPAVAYAEAR